MRFVVLLVALLALAALASPALAQSGAAFAPREENAEDYPDHPGREATFAFCAACHGFRIVAAQGMTREQWEGALAWMSQKHNMPPLDPAEKNVILGYLEQAFPPRTAPAGRGGWRNPFSQ
jgi:hypothetical protein